MNIFTKLQQKRNISSVKEKDFAREYAKVQNLEELSKKILKDGRKVTENTANCARAAEKVGHDLNLTVIDIEEECFTLQEFNKSMTKISDLSHAEGKLLQQTLVEPLRKYVNTFGQINMQAKQREKLLQDFIKLQNKLDKLKDKEDTGHNIVKKQNIRKELLPVEKEFTTKNTMLLNNLPAFYNSRMEYMYSILEALVMSQCYYHQQVHDVCDDYLKSILCENESEEKLSNDISTTLEEIRSLSITSDEK